MPRTELSAKGLKQGVDAQFNRRFDLEGYFNEEIEQAIGSTFEKKREQGFKHIMIVHAIFAPFFLSQENDVEGLRQEFISESGGEENIEFYAIKRTGEVVVLMK